MLAAITRLASPVLRWGAALATAAGLYKGTKEGASAAMHLITIGGGLFLLFQIITRR